MATKSFSSWLVLLLLALIDTCCAKPQNFEHHPIEARFRQHPDVVPVKYFVDLDLSDALEEPARAVYKGEVRLVVKFQASPRKCIGMNALFDINLSRCVGRHKSQKRLFKIRASDIILHADETVRIKTVEVVNAQGRALRIAKTGRDVSNQTIVLRMAKELPGDGRRAEIRLTFEAPIRDDGRGVFLRAVTRGGRDFRHVAANFQHSGARLIMPCLDLDHLKTSFDLRIKHSQSTSAHASTEIEERRSEGRNEWSVFRSTPQIPINMLAFALADFKPQELTRQMRPNLLLRFLSTPNLSMPDGHYALEIAQRAIEWFEGHIKPVFPITKLDLVAFGSHVEKTETLGLVFLRDLPAGDDARTKLLNRIRLTANIGAIVVRQWFFTDRWWSGLWVTEPFAVEMAHQFVIDVNPDYKYLINKARQ